MLERYLNKWNSRVVIPQSVKKCNTTLLGYELEVIKKESAPLIGNPVCNEIITDLENLDLLCKQDGSVYAEFVSLPMSPAVCINHISAVTDLLINKYPYFEAWSGGKCGFHIHLNRRSVKSKKNLYDFFVKYRNHFQTLSGRKNTYYCKFEEYTLYTNFSNPSCASRYTALNFKNKSTIEFRLWRGTLNHETLEMYIKLTAMLGKLSLYLPDLTFPEYLFLCDCDHSILYKLDLNVAGLLNQWTIDNIKREMRNLKTFFESHKLQRNIKNIKKYKLEKEKVKQAFFDYLTESQKTELAKNSQLQGELSTINF